MYVMLLSEIKELLLKEELLSDISDFGEIEIKGVEYDSRKVKPDTLFLCKGEGFKEQYLYNAAENGACAYVSEVKYKDCTIPYVIVKDIRRAMALIALKWYNNPCSRLDVIGITGTKGKTTTAYMIKSIMEHAGKKWGVIGTIEYDTGSRIIKPDNTTPESADLQKYLNEMTENGLSGASLEVSSQGLQYHRVDGCRFKNAIFLNIGEDHISPKEHKDFNEYLEAKCKIFGYSGIGIINGDDPNYEYIVDKAKSGRVILFGFSDHCDFKAYDIKKEDGCLKFTVRAPHFVHNFEIGMFGVFNIYNALAAIVSTALMGADAEDIYEGLKNVKVKGRAEVIEDGALTVIVDYAHNKTSFEALLGAAKKEYPGRRVVAVFGCPGGKAYLRRRGMGEVSASLADYTYLTADDPGFEDTDKIMDEIGSYIGNGGGRYEKIADREEAIKKSVLSASNGDVIIIAGKGHETTQKINGQSKPFEGDYPLAVKYLKIRNGK